MDDTNRFLFCIYSSQNNEKARVRSCLPLNPTYEHSWEGEKAEISEVTPHMGGEKERSFSSHAPYGLEQNRAFAAS